jgi:ABC-type transporter Mla subunit MlaD
METTDIAGQIVRTFESVVANGEAVRRYAEETEREIHRLWADNAELRDELHALSNRVESLTRAISTAPAEVAQRGHLRLQRDVSGDDAS